MQTRRQSDVAESHLTMEVRAGDCRRL